MNSYLPGPPFPNCGVTGLCHHTYLKFSLKNLLPQCKTLPVPECTCALGLLTQCLGQLFRTRHFSKLYMVVVPPADIPSPALRLKGKDLGCEVSLGYVTHDRERRMWQAPLSLWGPSRRHLGFRVHHAFSNKSGPFQNKPSVQSLHHTFASVPLWLPQEATRWHQRTCWLTSLFPH